MNKLALLFSVLALFFSVYTRIELKESLEFNKQCFDGVIDVLHSHKQAIEDLLLFQYLPKKK